MEFPDQISNCNPLGFGCGFICTLRSKWRAGQTSGSNAGIPDARHIIGQSIVATERSLEARDRYTYVERDQDRRLDSQGQLKSERVDVTRMILVNGARFGQLVERNGQLPSAAERKILDQDFEKLKHETPEERIARLGKEQENRSFLRDVVEAFDFRLLGEEVLGSLSTYVLRATPHRGFLASRKYGKMFSKVEGKLWIDKTDFGLIKVEGQVTQSFSLGLFVARVQRGSHVILEQKNVGAAVWLPQRLEVRASARISSAKGVSPLKGSSPTSRTIARRRMAFVFGEQIGVTLFAHKGYIWYFGMDSFIEVTSGATLLWRMSVDAELRDSQAV